MLKQATQYGIQFLTRHVQLSFTIQKLITMTWKLTPHSFSLHLFPHIKLRVIFNRRNQQPEEEEERKKIEKQPLPSLPISPFMAEEETNSVDRQTSGKHPNHPIGESVAPERKKPKHHQPCEDQVEPHNPFDADQVESQRQSSVTRDEYPTHDETELQAGSSCAVGDVSKEPIKTEALASSEDSGRERLKRHRVEVAGRVWIPDIWGQEELMKDWIDCSFFDASLVSSRIISARAALVAEGRRPSPSGLTIENRCKIYS